MAAYVIQTGDEETIVRFLEDQIQEGKVGTIKQVNLLIFSKV